MSRLPRIPARNLPTRKNRRPALAPYEPGSLHLDSGGSGDRSDIGLKGQVIIGLEPWRWQPGARQSFGQRSSGFVLAEGS